MKKNKALLLLSAALLISCGTQPGGGDSASGDASDSAAPSVDLIFAATSYEVRSGECLTVEGNPQGVTYSFQGGTPEGVSLDSSTGRIVFDEQGVPIPSRVYIATLNGKKASTVVSFHHEEAKPTITFSNDTAYVVDGDFVQATAKDAGGKEYAVGYELFEEVPGVSIDSGSGKLSFASNLADLTSFTVKASAKGVSVEKSFIAMTKNILTAKSSDAVFEIGDPADVHFQMDFHGNEAEASASASDFALFDEKGNAVTFAYENGKITIPSSALGGLEKGAHTFRLRTPRNSVTLEIDCATKILYDASDIEEAFEPNYDSNVPTFKEGSLDGYYVLGADIDLSSALEEGGSLYHDGASFLPIGAYEDEVYSIPFTGTFDGNGHEISSFTYTGEKAAVNGFFGCNQGTIKNLRLSGTLPAKSWSGGLVGNNQGTIDGVVCDLTLPNQGQSATGVIASINHGLIQNSFSLNPEVKGFNEAGQNFQNAGIIVGLNDVDGRLSNVYGISTDASSKLMGWSLNSEVSEESIGKRFSSLEELLSADFSSFSSPYVTWTSEGPQNEVLFVSPRLHGFDFDASLPSVLIPGQTLDLLVTAEPKENLEAIQSLVSYSLVGETHGWTLEGSTLNGQNADGADARLTVQASLTWNGKEYEATKNFALRPELQSIEIANTEESVIAGMPLKLLSTLSPEMEAPITYSLDLDSLGWKKSYVTLKGDSLLIDEDAPSFLTQVAVKAESMGKVSSWKLFTITHTQGLEGGYQIHYAGEEGGFEYTLPAGETVEKVYSGSTLLDSAAYSQSGTQLTVNGLSLQNGDTANLLILTSSASYRAYAAKREESKMDLAALQNAYGDQLTVISSQEEFLSYFPIDGQIHADKADNFASNKVYALNCDLDFEGQDFSPIGYQTLSSGESGNATFNGKFFGLGHTVKNMKISGSRYGAGFFFSLEGSAQDLNFSNSSIELNSGNSAGLLCGYFGGAAKARNIQSMGCSVTIGAAIPSNNSGYALAGIAGKAFGNKDIADCTYNGQAVRLYTE